MDEFEKIYLRLLDGNKNWVKNTLKENPDFFNNLSKGQNPPVLWIGCADSRVPANQITGTNPGEIFVHRNIANMVVHTDMNMLSVLDYAVNVLEVKHVIVCGHYGCGGILAAMGNKQYGLIDNWLRHIKDIYQIYRKELENIADKAKRGDRFVELNVIEQVADLCETSIIQNSWRKRKQPYVHGWVYDISNGIIKDLKVSVRDNTEMLDIFKLSEEGGKIGI
mgnify:CR=1 FL=1